MEEVIPLSVSDARGVAPEAVYEGGKKRGIASVNKGESELEQSDRKKARSVKKKLRRKKRAEKEADEKLVSRLNPGDGRTSYDERKLRDELKEARAGGKVADGELDKHSDYNKSDKYFARLSGMDGDGVGGGRRGKRQREGTGIRGGEGPRWGTLKCKIIN